MFGQMPERGIVYEGDSLKIGEQHSFLLGSLNERLSDLVWGTLSVDSV